VIVAEFFDAEESRVQQWARRPRAATLVAQLADRMRTGGAVRFLVMLDCARRKVPVRSCEVHAPTSSRR
jgi:hypothetical protein